MRNSVFDEFFGEPMVSKKEYDKVVKENRKLKEALAESEIIRREVAVCVHCGQYLAADESDREHWRVCPSHPARHENDRLVAQVEAMKRVMEIARDYVAMPITDYNKKYPNGPDPDADVAALIDNMLTALAAPEAQEKD